MKRSMMLGLAAAGAMGLVAAAMAQTAAPPAGGGGGADAAGPAGGVPGTTIYPPAAANGRRHFVVKGIRGGRPLDEATIKLMEQDRDLGAQVAEAAAQLRGADDADRAKLQQTIAELVARQFDVRQSLRQRELEELAEQITRLRALHDQRAAQKDRIVADRVTQVARDAEGLGWGDDEAGVGHELKFKWDSGGAWNIPAPGGPSPVKRVIVTGQPGGELPAIEESSEPRPF
jgi:hypothetical protein